jgi:acyl carrier protein
VSDDRLADLVRDVLELDPGTSPSEIARDSTESWDSLNHLRLVTAIEGEYAIELTMDEVVSISSFADIRNLVQQRCGL